MLKASSNKKKTQSNVNNQIIPKWIKNTTIYIYIFLTTVRGKFENQDRTEIKDKSNLVFRRK